MLVGILRLRDRSASPTGFSAQDDIGTGRGQPLPPPTKWTTSSRSPSLSVVSAQRSRGTMSRFSSTATRSCFMPSFSTRAERVKAGGTLTKSRSSPLICSFIKEVRGARSRHRQIVPCAASIRLCAGRTSSWRCVLRNSPARGARNPAATFLLPQS